MKYKYARILVVVIPLVLITIIMFFVTTTFAWNIEGGYFVKAEVHPGRQCNVTWIVLENKELVYCTYNPDVLNLEVGKYYWFGEGLISGNYGKTLLWVTDENPLVV